MTGKGSIAAGLQRNGIAYVAILALFGALVAFIGVMVLVLG